MGLGRVVVFDPAAGGSPGSEYRTATDLTRQRFADSGCDPDDAAALTDYYEDLYAKLLPGGQSAVAAAVNQARDHFQFRETAACFRMINDTGVPVIVDYDDPDGTARALVDQLALGATLEPEQWRYLQSRTATLPRRVAAGALADGFAESVGPPAHDGDQLSVLAWVGVYDPLRGIDQSQPDQADEVIW